MGLVKMPGLVHFGTFSPVWLVEILGTVKHYILILKEYVVVKVCNRPSFKEIMLYQVASFIHKNQSSRMLNFK